MDALAEFRMHFAACPLVAIIRGVQPEEAESIGGALVEAGFRIIEVPLNSPRPFNSIERLARRFGTEALIGGGTVLDADAVARLADAGGRIAVSPNTNGDVIRRSVVAGLVSAPGYFTPTEAFAALDAGAHALKLFPAEAGSPAGMQSFRAAGADGFGLGGALYRPGSTAQEVARRARTFVDALSESV